MNGRSFSAAVLGLGPKKGHKYSAVAVELDGIKFSSRREARRWAALTLLQRAGQITGLKRQVKIGLMGAHGPILTPTGRPAFYIADFVYRDTARGTEVVEDAKGFPTPEYKLKRAILAAQGIKIVEV